MKKFFIWPEPNFKNILFNWPILIKTSEVEKKFRDMFPFGYPVLCTSGRSAISFILKYLNKKRSDNIGVYPFASHCVLDAVSRFSTPTLDIFSNDTDLRLIYHQWGYVQETKSTSHSIDDCVDSLYIKKKKLFPSNGLFEVWSLPKIIGSSSGAILWCKKKSDAEKIKKIRDKNRSSLLQWILRIASKKNIVIYNYWNGGEFSSGKPTLFQNAEINSLIKKWNFFLSDRKEKFDILSKFIVKNLKFSNDRYPCVIPVVYNKYLEEYLKKKTNSGSRMFELLSKNNSRKLIKVLPIPIHQDVSLDFIIKIKSFLVNQKKYVD